MCGRYDIIKQERELLGRQVQGIKAIAQGERSPGAQQLILRADGPACLPWGFTQPWADRLIINLRAEKLRPGEWAYTLIGNRCAVPASLFYEWRGGTRYSIRSRQNGLIYFAGLYNADGFVILTTAANPAMADIHDRMPVMLDDEGKNIWLDDSTPVGDKLALLHPWPSDDTLVESPQAQLF